MKVDVVVNSMRQQVDPATQSRMIPTLSYRPGELLRGQVMLADGERLQVRLDNGRLLNALPADDVLLSPGSTVTLRVTGSMDGTAVMQLLSQEPSEAQLLGGEQTVDLALLRLGLKPTDANRALYEALSNWQAQPDGETMGRAAALLRDFPELGAEGAAFLAANRIPAGREQVDALLRLVAGYRLGDDLQALAENLLGRLQAYRGEPQGESAAQFAALLSEMAREPQTPQTVVVTGGQGNTANSSGVDQSQSGTTGAINVGESQLSAQAVGTAGTSQPLGAANLPAGAPVQTAVGTPVPAGQEPPAAAVLPATGEAPAEGTAAAGETPTVAVPPAAARDAQAVPQAGQPASGEDVVQTQPTPAPPIPTPGATAETTLPPDLGASTDPVAARGTVPTAEAAAEFRSLVALALDGQPPEQAQPGLQALARAGSEGQAGRLLLDALVLPAQEAAQQINAFAQTLPPADQPAVRELLGTVLDQLRALVDTQAAASPAANAEDGLPQLIRTVASLFVAVDAGVDGERLARAAADRTAHLQDMAARLDPNVAGDRDAARQVQRMNTTATLLSDINQYAYQQIPVQMNDRTRTVELYVMKGGKGRKKIDPENANILIALDTDHMGHLETAVHVSKKTVRLRFGVERPDLVGYVNGYLPDLADAMQAIGYRLGDLKLQVTERAVTPLTAPQVAAEETVPQGRLDITL